MDRYLLFMSWRDRRGGGPVAEGVSGSEAENIYNLLERSCTASLNTTVKDFPACSLVGTPGVKGWYFAIQSICGFSQFCSSDWEDISFDLESDKHKISVRRTIEEHLGDNQSTEEEDSCSRESLSLLDLYEESAENIHLLTDKLPAPGRAMVDVILQSLERDVPKLKDCLPVIGALKHLKEWHAAKITIVTRESKTSWQKVADYLSADILLPENLNKSIDSRELWRGKIQIWEQKFGSEITFPDYCIKGIATESPLSSLSLNSCFAADETRETKNTNACVSEVFHYYGSALKFVQIVLLPLIPSPLVSHLQYELCLARTDVDEKSLLFWDQISSLRGKVGALFVLPCRVSGMLIPLPSHLSTKKWKEYIAQKPNEINVPEADLKGEICNYYFVVQGNSNGGCTARLIYSADQINGAVALAEATGKLTPRPGQKETGLFDKFTSSLPCFCGEQILQREKKLALVQALALKHCLKRQKSTQELPVCSADELNCLLTRAREHFLQLWNASHQNTVRPVAVAEIKGLAAVCGLERKDSNLSKWPEKHVLQNLENFDKIKQKARVSEQLLGHKDGQKGSATSFDAKELLRHFTPEGLPTGSLQPLRIQKSENAFLLTPELTPRKLRSLPFEKASGCHYHGLEYCLDNRRALERDVGFAELQARLIRYETQTTCTKDSCLMPWVLSPAPSPAVLSESGSVPDGESLKKEIQAKSSGLKRRSNNQDGSYPHKRLLKSESTDSFLSQASGSSGSHHAREAKDPCPEVPSGTVRHHNRVHRLNTKSSLASQRCGNESEILKLTKESRSQKHTRMLKEVVTNTLEKHGVAEDHKCFATCSQRLFEISKCYLKDLKTSRGLFDEMKKAANSNVKQVIEWVLEKTNEK